MDLLTCPYVHNPDEARAMAEAGADVLVPHVGLTTKGMIGAKSAIDLDEAARRVQAMADAAKAVRPDILVLCHGGPIAEPEDAASIFAKTTRDRRLLRRQQHRAPADRAGDRRPGEGVHGADAGRTMSVRRRCIHGGVPPAAARRRSGLRRAGPDGGRRSRLRVGTRRESSRIELTARPRGVWPRGRAPLR